MYPFQNSRIDVPKRAVITMIAMCFNMSLMDVELGLAFHTDMTELTIKNEDINDDANYQREIEVFGSKARLNRAIRAAKAMDLISIKKRRYGRAIYIRKTPDDFYNKVSRFIKDIEKDLADIRDKPEKRPRPAPPQVDKIYIKLRNNALVSVNRRIAKKQVLEQRKNTQ